MGWKHPAGHGQVKKLIASCAATGAGIDYIEAAPNFRFVPVSQAERTLESGPPSKRGTIACGKARKLKNWTPSRLDLNPMYGCPMAGDSWEFHKAKAAWAKGDPKPLRQHLAREAEARRLCEQRERRSVAA